MKRHIRTESQQKQETHTQAQEELSKDAVREFATPEEMLRHDAAHTPVPPRLAGRLDESINESAPAPQQSWWRKIFGLGS